MDQSIDGDEPASATTPASPYHLAGASKDAEPCATRSVLVCRGWSIFWSILLVTACSVFQAYSTYLDASEFFLGLPRGWERKEAKIDDLEAETES